jgi:hypothetical protein
MGPAIGAVFYKTLHKLCRWHIIHKYSIHIAMLYKRFPTFESEFQSILNWPLMPREFEKAWEELVEKYGLQDDHMMVRLYEDRMDWISAYFKATFCARMTSTQRSESMNFVLKRGYVSVDKNLHRFAEQVNNCIFTRRQLENAQDHASTVRKK